MNIKKLKLDSISPKLLLILSIISVIGIVITFILEYQARKQDYLLLFEKQAKLFINAVSSSTQNAISAAEKIESEINSKILTNLRIIQQLDEDKKLSNAKLKELLDISNLKALHLYNSQGKLIQSASKNNLTFKIPDSFIKSRLQKSVKDTILTIYDEMDSENDQLVAIAKNKSGGFIAAIINDDDIKSLRRSVGIGYFLKRFQSKENIEYVVIQNSFTIIAGSFGSYELSSFSKDSLLQQAADNNKPISRILYYNSKPVFETISPFSFGEESYGILRLGLSMEEYERLESDMEKRFFIISAVVVIFAFIFISFLISYKHRQLLNRDLGRLRNFTNTILDNLSSGVISINQDGFIQSINKKATVLLDIKFEDVINKQLTVLQKQWQVVIHQIISSEKNNSTTSKHWITNKENRKRLIAFQKDILKDEESKNTFIILFDDITEQKLLEEQLKRNQKLSAMGKLASSVAHEIKNPLNAIKLIVDLVRKKYKPSKDEEIYFHNMNTVSLEIDRMNNIIEQYLRFNRMPEMNLTSIDFSQLVDEIAELFKSGFAEKYILLKRNIENNPPFNGDKDQLKQVFINLLKNAEEAIEQGGEISITGKVVNSFYELLIKDTGKGIPEDDLNYIFDLHFTTKKKGNGIGLSVVQQIVAAHDGKIYVESEVGKGTTIILQFPLINL